MRIILTLVLAALLSLPLTACSGKIDEKNVVSAIPVENRAAPDFKIISADGTQLTLSSLKGKVVMLNFWATWCPPCREEIPSLIRLEKIMTGKAFVMLPVSVDQGGRPAVDAFLKSKKYDFKVYTDLEGFSSKSYGITGVPETFIIDKNGILVKRVIGPLDWDDQEVVSYLTKLVQ